MAARRTALVLLRAATFLTIALGLTGAVGGFFSGQMVSAFGVPIPAWLVGAAVAFVGVRYWLRLRDLEKKIALQG